MKSSRHKFELGYVDKLRHFIYNIPYISQKIWRELNLADWPQPAKTRILAIFNLADSQVRSTHAPNLPPERTCVLEIVMGQFDRVM